MKQFKFWGMLVACLMLALGFTSCSNDDDKPKGDDLMENLQGGWTFSTMKIKTLGQTVEMDIDDIRGNSGYDKFYDEYLTFNGDKVNGSTYRVDGNKIMLPWYEDLGWWGAVSFSGANMTMYYDLDYEGVDMKLWITYTKSGRGIMSPVDVDAQKLLNEAVTTVKK